MRLNEQGVIHDAQAGKTLHIPTCQSGMSAAREGPVDLHRRLLIVIIKLAATETQSAMPTWQGSGAHQSTMARLRFQH